MWEGCLLGIFSGAEQSEYVSSGIIWEINRSKTFLQHSIVVLWFGNVCEHVCLCVYVCIHV